MAKKEIERNSFNELLVILLKLVFYIVLIYFNNNKPMLYESVPVLDKIGYSLMIFFSASLVVSIVRFIIIRLYIRRNKLKNKVKDNFIIGINQIESVLNTVFVIIAVMYFLDINPITFLTSITIVAAAIALLTKEYIANMINGLIIMFSDRLSLGDHIRIGNEEGKILDLTLINVILQNEDNDMVLIPNSVVFNSIIVNQSKQNVKKLTVDFEVDINRKLTSGILEEEFETIIKDFKEFIVEDGLSVKVTAIKKDFVHFKVQVLLRYYDKLREKQIRRLLQGRILELSSAKE